MNYLKYIEHSAENLQFYLWFRDYTARWDALPQSEKVLSPEWTRDQAEAEFAANAPSRPKKMNHEVAAALKGSDFADAPKTTVSERDPFGTPSKSSHEDRSDYGSSHAHTFGASTHESVADQAFQDAGLKWKPCKSTAIVAVSARAHHLQLQPSPTETKSNASLRSTLLTAHLASSTYPPAIAQLS